MALIDVSELLTDPDLVDISPITVHRSSVAVNSKGRGTTTPATFTIVASVQPASSDVLNRLPDGVNQNGTITVYTQTQLFVGAAPIVADELDWNGRRYVVTMIDDWSNYGNGYTAAHCSLKTLSP